MNARKEAVKGDGHLWFRVPDQGPLEGWRCFRCGYFAKPYDQEPSWPSCSSVVLSKRANDVDA